MLINNPIKEWILRNILFSAKFIWRVSEDAIYNPEGRPSNIQALHFYRDENGWTCCHTNSEMCSNLILFFSTKIEKTKFGTTNNHPCMWNFPVNRENIISQNIEAEWSSHTESIWLK